MPDLVIPDVSEFQSVDFSVFSGPIIVRAHNGYRTDYRWIQHATGACHQPWWAAYQYLPATVDATAAAQQFLVTLAGFRPNATILDLEEGDGDQSQRQHDWLTVMASDPAKDWTYSGDYFARAHGLTVDWVAAYQNREPTTAHQLWQFTDAHDFPGIGTCDASVFFGTVEDLIALTSSRVEALAASNPIPVTIPSLSDAEDEPMTVYRVASSQAVFAVKDGKLLYIPDHNDQLRAIAAAGGPERFMDGVSDHWHDTCLSAYGPAIG